MLSSLMRGSIRFAGIPVALLVLLASSAAWAQLLVVPRRAYQSRVRYFDFDWKSADITTSATIAVGTTTTSTTVVAEYVDEEDKLRPDVRLFFYERERDIAELATAVIRRHYEELVRAFRHRPSETFPYVLYSSYQEFLQTTLFPVQEGVLGVTSPRDLVLALPYFGDHPLFDHVSGHELAHQFTIQKVRDYARAADVAADPLRGMPLWFIEGIAEYYSQHGLDPETEMVVRDLVVNPNAFEGYVMLDFFTDQPYSGLWTYQVGHMRCAFIEEVYGHNTLQRLLESSPRMVGSVGDDRALGSFAALFRHVTGDDQHAVTTKFENWLKQRSFKAYLDFQTALTEPKPRLRPSDPINALNASPDGHLLLLRAIIPERGETQLVLVDDRAPEVQWTIVADGIPSVESLHPVAERNFDLDADELVFFAESKGADVLYWQEFTHSAESQTDPDTKQETWRVDLELKPRRMYKLSEHGIVAAYSPALSPEGDRVAFVGLKGGLRDVYVLTPGEDDEFTLERVTNDVYSERTVSWGPRGLVFNSDATGHGHFNLFRAAPTATATITVLTNDARDHLDPEMLPDGRVMFVAYNGSRANVFEALPDRMIQRTAVSTGIFSPSPGLDGGIWALHFRSGRRVVVPLAAKDMIAGEVSTSKPTTSPDPRPEIALADAAEYDALDISNWQLGQIFGIAGAGGGGIFGQIFATAYDRLRNHSLVINVAISGSFDLTDGYALYTNQASRWTWGAGPFQWLRFRRAFSQEGIPTTIRGERFFGARGVVRYPLDRFLYTQLELALGGSAPLTIGFDDLDIVDDTDSGPVRAQTEASLRLGYDTLVYHPTSGPIDGTSILLEATGGVLPFDAQTYAFLRLDFEHYIPIIGRTNIFFRMGAGGSFDPAAPQFYLSKLYTLRGVDFDRLDVLLGNFFAYSTAELQIPLTSILRVAFLSDIVGIVGVDAGFAADEPSDLADKRVLDIVTGLNMVLGPLVFRLHFAWPIDIGGPLADKDSVVTNFSLGWLYAPL